MSTSFFDHPILNSPYDYPNRHWELNADGQPTQNILNYRRGARFITPIPKPRKKMQQQELFSDATASRISSEDQEYRLSERIDELRAHINEIINMKSTTAVFSVSIISSRYEIRHPLIFETSGNLGL